MPAQRGVNQGKNEEGCLQKGAIGLLGLNKRFAGKCHM